VSKPRYQRRKEDRPQEITAAALEAFAEKGYAATRVTDVAQRAGVSKGLLYLYFRTKEELFKAVIRSFVSPRIDALKMEIENTELTAAEYFRGPFTEFAKQVPKSPARILVRLMIAEGAKHPDLTNWYHDNVVTHGLSALRALIERGVRNGEFRKSALQEFPHMVVAPVAFAIVWSLVFSPRHKLDSDRFIESHLALLLDSIKLRDNSERTGST
jgi:AcrR family transcriptional regulator